jgi:hypothetical protein
MPGYTRRCAIAPTNEVAEVTDEAEREAYERTYCTPRPISGGFVGRSATVRLLNCGE